MDKIIHLSITKKSVPIRMDFVQYATNPNIIFILDDYTPAVGATASLYIEKPSGAEIYNACSIWENKITYSPTTQSFAEEGTSTCQLQIVEPSGTAVSFLIFADVTKNIIDSSAIESTDEFTRLEEALQDLSRYDGRITTALNTAEEAIGIANDLETRVDANEANITTNAGNIETNATNIAALQTRGVVRNLPAGSTLTITLTSRQCVLVMVSGGTALQHRGAWLVQAGTDGNPSNIELKACSSVTLTAGEMTLAIQNNSVAKYVTIIGASAVNYTIA